MPIFTGVMREGGLAYGIDEYGMEASSTSSGDSNAMFVVLDDWSDEEDMDYMLSQAGS